MGEKYTIKHDTDIWGNDQIVAHRNVSASDVGGAIRNGRRISNGRPPKF